MQNLISVYDLYMRLLIELNTIHMTKQQWTCIETYLQVWAFWRISDTTCVHDCAPESIYVGEFLDEFPHVKSIRGIESVRRKRHFPKDKDISKTPSKTKDRLKTNFKDKDWKDRPSLLLMYMVANT